MVSVDGPYSRRDQFEQMTFSIAKINASADFRLLCFTFDCDSEVQQMLSPRFVVGRGNSKANVKWATSIMRRNNAARYTRRGKRGATSKQK
jgi:hypothetical protein